MQATRAATLPRVRLPLLPDMVLAATAMRLETSHRPALGSVLVLMGIALLPSVTVLGIIILAAGIYLVLRKPIALITAADGCSASFGRLALDAF